MVVGNTIDYYHHVRDFGMRVVSFCLRSCRNVVEKVQDY